MGKRCKHPRGPRLKATDFSVAPTAAAGRRLPTIGRPGMRRIKHKLRLPVCKYCEAEWWKYQPPQKIAPWRRSPAQWESVIAKKIPVFLWPAVIRMVWWYYAELTPEYRKEWDEMFMGFRMYIDFYRPEKKTLMKALYSIDFEYVKSRMKGYAT